MEIVKIYEEHISGAKKNEERQVLTECLDYCTKNHVDYLLLSELSRLGRSTLQVLKSLEQLHEAKVSVYIQNLGLYSLQPNGEVNPIASILITVLAEMGNIEAKRNVPEKLNDAFRFAKRNVTFSGSFPTTKKRLRFLWGVFFFSMLFQTFKSNFTFSSPSSSWRVRSWLFSYMCTLPRFSVMLFRGKSICRAMR